MPFHSSSGFTSGIFSAQMSTQSSHTLQVSASQPSYPDQPDQNCIKYSFLLGASLALYTDWSQICSGWRKVMCSAGSMTPLKESEYYKKLLPFHKSSLPKGTSYKNKIVSHTAIKWSLYDQLHLHCL